MLDWFFTLEGETRELKIRNVEYEFQLIARNGSPFDIYVVLNGLSNWLRTVNTINNGKGKFSSNFLNRNKKLSRNRYGPQYINMRCDWHLLIAV